MSQQIVAYDHVVDDALDYDMYFGMMTSRDTTNRRAFVAKIFDFVKRKYAVSFDSPHDSQFHDEITWLFEFASQTTPDANIVQCFIIHYAVAAETEIARVLCPPPPDQDNPDEHDMALVDRVTFCDFERNHLLPTFANIATGSVATMYEIVYTLNAQYTLPLNVRAAAAASARRIVFRTTKFIPS